MVYTEGWSTLRGGLHRGGLHGEVVYTERCAVLVYIKRGSRLKGLYTKGGLLRAGLHCIRTNTVYTT